MARSSFKNPFKFRKRIKIAPGITVNLSKSGVSATVGVKGASVNVGKNGTYLNVGIPGTGVYTRTKLKGAEKVKEPTCINDVNLLEEPVAVNKKSLTEKIKDYTNNAERDNFLYKFPKKYRDTIKRFVIGYQIEDYKKLSKELNIKNAVIMGYISFFLGWLGVDRFLLKDKKKGIIKFLVLPIIPVSLIWWIVDIFLSCKKVQNNNYEKLLASGFDPLEVENMVNNDTQELIEQNSSQSTELALDVADVTTEQSNDKLEVRILEALSRYSFVNSDKKAILAKYLSGKDDIFGDELLSLEDKKKLNLNTRAKYLRGLVECFNDVEQLDFDIKFFCSNVTYTERSILWALDEIDKYKNVDCINKVRLEGIGEWDDKIYPINKIPPMPLVDHTKEKVLFFVTPKI
ncbi:DUF4236 domain-containing protein [Pasteurella multocida]|uniref:DUF4236 domain-containing protein n=1 Tax=Pasteurella multocida TaxID=747 RepID=UPI0013F3D5A3|nr:DUF4236 domain-containing protein [Pasteurella multocida]MDY0577891.1 DUF4236 domain-containing protein [Pasteurella multocida]MEB3472724.1 DUF4236 domain-containing protein [Pasteurella multocida]MEB3486758.1 DUF4236 domain-containing protein [Pasteurella multocida]MEB3497447.1 DUF4236 domain-containing protein [Pasteurella multocida]MEB3501989.1 DUF4236 domain-containing protein [Pasteurella multocida]